MNRKVTVVGGAGAVGATVARAIADKELADVVIIDIADQKAAGVGLDMLEACPIEGSDSRIVGYGANDEGWKATADSDVVVITSGMPRKPGMSRDDLLNTNYKHHAGGHRADRQVLAEHHHRAGGEPARRDGAGGLPAEQVPARARHRHGRRARLGAHAHVHRDGAERLGRERPRVRARRPRRHDGAAAALLDRRRHSDHRSAVEGADRRHLQADGRWRRRDHQAGRHERLVRARVGGGRDGRSDPEGQEEDPAVLGLPPGRVRRSATCSSACP